MKKNKEQNTSPSQSIWIVTREYEGFAGAGGVKDVSRQLAEALVSTAKAQVSVILPRYGFMDAKALGFELVPVGDWGGIIRGTYYEHGLLIDMDYVEQERREAVVLWKGVFAGVTLYLVEAQRFAEKQGVYTYTEADELLQSWQRKGEGHYDYFAMNILLQKTALDLMIVLDEHPDIIHCQDGHAATLPAMMRENCGYRPYFRNTGAVVTIHNAGAGYHQEVGDLKFARAITGLPLHVINSSLLEGNFDPFVAAAPYALLNTVSENYARELQQTPEDSRTDWLGHTLLTQGVQLVGITNGIDPQSFDPARPAHLHLPAAFDVLKGDLAGKRKCKESLLASLQDASVRTNVVQYGSLENAPERPLCTFIGRLTAQKGVDILITAIADVLARDDASQFLVFGSGAAHLEEQLQRLCLTEAGRVCFLQGFDPDLANLIYAAGDFFLIPSRYEPCGLTDYMAQLMGNLPVVHHVGGLVKVIDGETGFAYQRDGAGALAEALERALSVYREQPQMILEMQQAAVKRIYEKHTWQHVMLAYEKLYEQSLTMLHKKTWSGSVQA